MDNDGQITLGDVYDEYDAFVEKFKPKKTTDDCYTPEIVHEAVVAYVERRYGIDRDRFVRPFWPGANYRETVYPEACVVVDNPPFSIISKIVKDYLKWGVHFFLYSPYLTNIGIAAGDARVCHVVCDADVTYENGATVNTSFVTDLEPGIIAMTAPELCDAIKKANMENRKIGAKVLPKYEYPVHVLTATMLGYMAAKGVEFSVRAEDAVFIRRLDDQVRLGKAIYGSGLLLSEKAAAEKAAAEKAAAEKWILSERELSIIASLGRVGA